MPAGFDTFNILPGQDVYKDPTYLNKSNWNDEENKAIPKKVL